MFENDIESIIKSQKGNKEELQKLIEKNNRTYLEYCKKIYRKRVWNRRFISNWLYGIH